MKSSNPVFARSAEFNGRGGAVANDPSQWQVDLSGNPTHTERGTGTGRMTIDSVVEKTGITLGPACAGGAVTWFVIGDLNDADVSKRAAQGTATAGDGRCAHRLRAGDGQLVQEGHQPGRWCWPTPWSKVSSSAPSPRSSRLASAIRAIVFQAVLGTVIAFFGTLGCLQVLQHPGDRASSARSSRSRCSAFVGVLLVNCC